MLRMISDFVVSLAQLLGVEDSRTPMDLEKTSPQQPSPSKYAPAAAKLLEVRQQQIVCGNPHHITTEFCGTRSFITPVVVVCGLLEIRYQCAAAARSTSTFMYSFNS